jgi:protein-L-isoaspartate(D-aspartate) O-methyltransferase
LNDLAYQRRRMVRRLESEFGVRDTRVLTAMGTVPRHRFVRQHLRAQAYSVHALPIGEAQTISQPAVVARMSELLEVEAGHSVLEVGTGSGYQTAILAELACRVFSLEIVPSLAQAAIRRIRELGYDNVKIQAFDGTVGWSDAAPFDRILVTAGAPTLPEPLLKQLAPGGRLVIPEGERNAQRLVVYDQRAKRVLRRVGESVAFVPLLGKHGWDGEGGSA